MKIHCREHGGILYLGLEVDYAEHKGKKYYVYFKDMDIDKYYLEFSKKWNMEEFLYDKEVYNYTYRSSNGKVYKKKWEYIKDKVEKKRAYWYRKGEEYSFFTGHYIGDNNENV